MKQEPQLHEQYERDEHIKGSSDRTLGIVPLVVSSLVLVVGNCFCFLVKEVQDLALKLDCKNAFELD